MLRNAEQGRGMFTVGSATRTEADELGRAWVGPNYRVASDGRTLIQVLPDGSNGYRQYRPPAYKDRRGVTQANLESRSGTSGTWENNGHIDIIDP